MANNELLIEERQADIGQFILAKDLPKWNDDNLTITLIAGEGYGRVFPLNVYSPLFMIKIESSAHQEICINGQLKGEIAIVVVRGEIHEENKTIVAGQMLISKTKDICTINVCSNTCLLLFGGEPLKQEPFLMWNFVSASKEKLNQAKQDWQNKAFLQVPGDDSYIPFPSR